MSSVRWGATAMGKLWNVMQNAWKATQYFYTSKDGHFPYMVKIVKRCDASFDVTVHKFKLREKLKTNEPKPHMYEDVPVLVEMDVPSVWVPFPTVKNVGSTRQWFNVGRGNSILIHCRDDTYVFIGGELLRFTTPEPIENFYSEIIRGKSRPVATSKDYVYMIPKRKMIDKHIFGSFDDWKNASVMWEKLKLDDNAISIPNIQDATESIPEEVSSLLTTPRDVQEAPMVNAVYGRDSFDEYDFGDQPVEEKYDYRDDFSESYEDSEREYGSALIGQYTVNTRQHSDGRSSVTITDRSGVMIAETVAEKIWRDFTYEGGEAILMSLGGSEYMFVSRKGVYSFEAPEYISDFEVVMDRDIPRALAQGDTYVYLLSHASYVRKSRIRYLQNPYEEPGIRDISERLPHLRILSKQ